MNHPITNGTTTGSYCPMPMYTTRPGADAHKRFASLTTGKAPAKAAAIYLPPPTTIAPRARTMTAPKVQIPAKPVKPATKRKLKDEDHSTPYQPQTKLVAATPEQNPVADNPRSAASGRKPTAYTNLDLIEICNDPLPTARALPDLKYQSVFDRLKPGQCIKCAPADVGKIACGLRKYFERKGITDKVKTASRYEADGMGRVWWAAEKAAA